MSPVIVLAESDGELENQSRKILKICRQNFDARENRSAAIPANPMTSFGLGEPGRSS
jgi:hypothetical protein